MKLSEIKTMITKQTLGPILTERVLGKLPATLAAVALFTTLPALGTTVTGCLWEDLNGNGIKEEGEPLVNGVEVRFYRCDFDPDRYIYSEFTGLGGNLPGEVKNFVNLNTSWSLQYVLPAGYFFSPTGQAPADQVGSDADPSTGFTPCVSINEAYTSHAFCTGIYRPASLGNFVFHDLNQNGIQDSGEPGIGGVTVELRDCDGNTLHSVLTDSTGKYEFTNLAPGNYSVKVTIPAGYVASPQDQGADDALDSDIDTTGLMTCTTLVSGENDPTWDAGLITAGPGPGGDPAGTGTPGYWKNHPEAWPVSSITVGGVVYTRDQAIALLETPVRGDKRISMFAALVCAKLNVLIGNESSCVTATITAADAWMATYGGSRVTGSSAAWTLGSPLHTTLDDYNNGLLCAPHRD